MEKKIELVNGIMVSNTQVDNMLSWIWEHCLSYQDYFHVLYKHLGYSEEDLLIEMRSIFDDESQEFYDNLMREIKYGF